MNVDFNNTEIAFRHKKRSDLRHSLALFQSLKYQWLINWSMPLMKIALLLSPLRSLLKRYLFKQFVGGESIEECLETVHRSFNTNRVGSILDYSVEGQLTEQGFDDTTREIIKTIEIGANEEAIPFAVFKFTGITSKKALRSIQTGSVVTDRLQKRIQNIVKSIETKQQKTFIDAEETWIQDAIFSIGQEMTTRLNKEKALVYHTIQCYRKDAMQILTKLHEKCQSHQVILGVKLVRGAYLEKEREQARKRGYPSPICNSKEETDQNFNEAVKYCIENIDSIETCIASHNEESYHKLLQLMHEKGIDRSDHRIFNAQLYGMSDHITYNLIHAKYNVVKYLPYGPFKEVLPYLSRRAQENKSIGGQSSRELQLIRKEVKRRKKS